MASNQRRSNLGQEHVGSSSPNNEFEFENPQNTQQNEEDFEIESGRRVRGRGGRARGGGSGRARGGGGRNPPRESAPQSDTFAIHFTKRKITPDDDYNLEASCNYCTKVYPFKKGGGHGTLNTHTTNHHPEKLGISTTQSQLQFQSTSGAQQGSSFSSVLFKFDKWVYRDELAKLVCVKGLPFNFADDDYFDAFVRLSLNPAAGRVPRSNLVRDITRVVKKYKKSLIDDLSKLENKVSICADGDGDITRVVKKYKKSLIDDLSKLENKVSICADGDGDNENPSTILANVKGDLLTLFNEYNVLYGNTSQQQQQQDEEDFPSQQHGASADPYSFFNDLYSRKSGPIRGSSSSANNIPLELETYFTITFELNKPNSQEFDVLQWWARRKEIYPILSIVAKEVLASPASTVAVESAFSVGGNVLDERRSQLTSENLEHQLLLGDWVRAEKRQQDLPYQEDLILSDPKYQYDVETPSESSDD